MKSIIMNLIGAILALAFPAGVSGQSLRAQALPLIIVSLNTTREVATKYSSVWDIQKKGSRRLDDDMVQLRVVVNQEAELMALGELQDAGVLTFEKEREFHQRMLGGINSELSCYRTVDEAYATMDQLATSHSQFVTVSKIGESWLQKQGRGGHDVKVMVITSPSNAIAKDNMVVVGGSHSRELPPPEAILRWAEHLLANYGSDPDITWILDRTNIHLIPIANPDGREIVQEHLSWYYRKNAHESGCSSVSSDGVDLNRNYPMWWGRPGASTDPCASDYRGVGRLSEPESSSVYNYASGLFSADMKKGTPAEAEAKAGEACPSNAVGIFIDVHSSGDFVYFPWGYMDSRSPNHVPLLTMAAKLAYPGGYALWGPEQDGFLYFVSGDATDATYGIDCVPSYGYEIGSEFYASCRELESSIVPILTQSLLYAAKAVSAPYRIPLGPDILKIEVIDSDPANTILLVGVSEDALIVPHARFKTPRCQSPCTISSVKVFVDVHPYDENAIGLDMAAQDGAFDSVDEVATLTLNTVGVQVLYFEATGSDGNQGPVSAIFVNGNGSTNAPTKGGPAVSCFTILSDIVDDWFHWDV